MPQFILNNLDVWFRILTTSAILLPIIGGFAGWGALSLGDKISARDAKASKLELDSTKDEVSKTRAELLATKTELAATHSLAVKTEIATRPKTPEQQLIDFIKIINPAMLEGLATADAGFEGELRSDLNTEYQRLLRVPELQPYLQQLKIDDPVVGFLTDGTTTTTVKFVVRKSLLGSAGTK
jgi:hypothetical protein